MSWPGGQRGDSVQRSVGVSEKEHFDVELAGVTADPAVPALLPGETYRSCEVKMVSKRLFFAFVICLFLMMGCARGERERQGQSPEPMLTRSAPVPAASQEGSGDAVDSRRFIAVRHSVLLEAAESELPKAWEAVGEFCQSIRCEIISSSIRQKTYDSPPTAALSLRVAPEDVKRLFEQLGKVGRILEHRTESEDQTSTVIDVEAKLKNLTELRDRLRQMLATPSGSLKDIVEVERELSRAQSELDSLQMRRKALANETEKVSVDIAFRSRKSVAETGTFAPIATAWHEAGHVLAESIAFAITFVVAVVPWLVLFVPTLWLSIKGFKKLRGKRTVKEKS
ncbi:MAG: DUF4349 domain-containing protein [Syntrophobacteraceae bacterium]